MIPIQMIRDEDAEVALESAGRQTGHELIGLTVMDGFKFGCGFALALAIGLLATLIVMTAFGVVAALIGIRLPGA